MSVLSRRVRERAQVSLVPYPAATLYPMRSPKKTPACRAYSRFVES
jgi:hypothetical protein